MTRNTKAVDLNQALAQTNTHQSKRTIGVYWEGIKQAFDEMRHHKLRTSLTLLGMIFGVGAVIAMLSVGEGAEREALKMIESMGVKNLVVNDRPADGEALKSIREHSIGLSLRDIESARDTLPFVENWSAEKNVKVFSLFSLKGRSDAQVVGVTPSYFELSSLPLGEGRTLLDSDELYYQQVAVLGPEAARSLFPQGGAIDSLIKVNHQWFTVVGVLSEKEGSKSTIQGVKLGGERNQVFIPLTTALKKMQFASLESELDAFKLALADGVEPSLAAKSLQHLLNRRHGGEKDFDVVVPADLLAQHQKTQQIFNIVMACVAGISLLVGGIGIMNIMLATILERTGEIGLLRALGAKRRDIARQFLIESIAISATGGIIGIGVGLLLALVISSAAGWPVAWSPFAILLSLGVCMTIGVGFGLYPANKAAKLDPIIALQRD
ncbi:ABC transporter permease [Shewanella fidelis]|uniref:ABC transporter permease n=2 Tax=Shewanella fidelis TaxID=173509 RepID=A0AAW8NJW8_9GAMM|nr:ABC transporter permease [Shewanella fidelis]MDR8523592.1 ABC transporter permease [Shewanella fidelis]MDW4810139.1 ABC transporter permease [Shewanella fidelis]MDW4814284.1 ABC transporter permease [Shewanella fidelis]MDW4818375.1 ABC transporter permease [Shewanella fidelis]MDW4823973.1 ABC transporter permease [Shewanella fidelis]